MKSILGLLLWCLLTAALSAQVPNSIVHQGYLTDGSGIPIDDTVQLTLSLYDQPEMGSLIWVDDTTGVKVDHGIFSVYLGPGGTPPLEEVDFRRQLYLGVAVNGGVELVPRTPLKAVPYALSVRAPQVAFMASVTEDIIHPLSTEHPYEIVIFDSVHANPGGGYDSNTGIFTVPVAGWYQFNFAMQGYPHSPHASEWTAFIAIFSNSPHAYYGLDQDDQTVNNGIASSVTVWAGEGDEVNVSSDARSIQGNLSTFHISHFSGHLIFASRTPE
jgi:hypothetical protein